MLKEQADRDRVRPNHEHGQEVRMAAPIGERERSSDELHKHQLDMAGGDPGSFTIPDPHLREAVDAWWNSHGRVAVAHPSVAGVAWFTDDPTVDDGTMLHRQLFLTVFQIDGLASKVLEARPARIERDDAGRVLAPAFEEQPFETVVFEGLLSWDSMKPRTNFSVYSSDLPRDFVGHQRERQTLAIHPATLIDRTVRRGLGFYRPPVRPRRAPGNR